MKIFVNNEQDKITLDGKIEDALKLVVKESLKVEGVGTDFEVSITFVDDSEIKTLNKQYRNIDKHTDVLSFPIYDEDIELPYTPLLGDIVISLETAKRQSKEFEHSIEREVLYLTAHSMFHLLGYDHLEEDEKNLMRQKEKQVMKNIGVYKGENH